MALFKAFVLALIYHCSAGISWNEDFSKPKSIRRLAGEWVLFNCTVNTSDNATLYYNERNSANNLTVVHVDNKRVKMPVKNVFNISNVKSTDEGFFTCKACNQSRKRVFLQIYEGKISTSIQ